MRHGITQDQVTDAADAIVVAGDKPTVEKVRARLGTGSPNTVTRMLEVWRQGLAERLHDALSVPELPSGVGEAMAGVWRLAVDHARDLAQAQLQQERDALSTARADLEQERTQLSSLQLEADAARARVAAALDAAVQRGVDLEARLTEAQQEKDELRQSRDRLQHVADQRAAEIERLSAQRAALESTSVKERERHDAHLSCVENRAHQEVDRARQEAKALREELKLTKRDHAKALAALDQERATLQHALREAETHAATQAGHAAALQSALERLPGLKGKPQKARAPGRPPNPVPGRPDRSAGGRFVRRPSTKRRLLVDPS